MSKGCIRVCLLELSIDNSYLSQISRMWNSTHDVNKEQQEGLEQFTEEDTPKGSMFENTAANEITLSLDGIEIA